MSTHRRESHPHARKRPAPYLVLHRRTVALRASSVTRVASVSLGRGPNDFSPVRQYRTSSHQCTSTERTLPVHDRTLQMDSRLRALERSPRRRLFFFAPPHLRPPRARSLMRCVASRHPLASAGTRVRRAAPSSARARRAPAAPARSRSSFSLRTVANTLNRLSSGESLDADKLLQIWPRGETMQE